MFPGNEGPAERGVRASVVVKKRRNGRGVKGRRTVERKEDGDKDNPATSAPRGWTEPESVNAECSTRPMSSDAFFCRRTHRG